MSRLSPRWKVLALLMGYAFMCHFNRVSMSAAGTERLMEQYGISPERMGWVYSAYLIAYTICMTPGGWLIDRFGPKAALVAMGFGSATFVALTGAVGLLGLTVLAWPVFLVMRAAAGLFSAPVHPAGARAVSLWFPTNSQAMGNGLITAAALLGISTTYYLFGAMMDALGWPAAFGVAGLATAAIAVVWACYASDGPACCEPCHDPVGPPAPNGHCTAGSGTKTRAGLNEPWYTLLSDRSLVLLTVSYAAVGYFEYLFFYWMQYYFDHVLELGKDRSRLSRRSRRRRWPVECTLGGTWRTGSDCDSDGGRAERPCRCWEWS
jgi:MFS family permease